MNKDESKFKINIKKNPGNRCSVSLAGCPGMLREYLTSLSPPARCGSSRQRADTPKGFHCPNANEHRCKIKDGTRWDASSVFLNHQLNVFLYLTLCSADK